jgi:dUTP pyrophosphatase
MKYYSESGLEIKYAKEGDAGLDLPFYEKGVPSVTLNPGESFLFKTGIHMAIPEGHVGILDSRSSTSKLKLDILCRTIDCGFRGNIKLSFINLSKEPVKVVQGDFLAQVVVMKLLEDRGLEKVSTVEELGTTERQFDEFGSTKNATHLLEGEEVNE